MKLVTDYLRELATGTAQGWNRFWFTPADPATLGMVRILGGAMLLYTHLVWTQGLNDFFTDEGWLSTVAVESFQGGGYAWSYFWLLKSPGAILAAHVAALAAMLCLTLGLFTRVSAVLTAVATISYVNRAPGALFGLDQVNAMLALYLMVGPAGDAYSLDRLRLSRRPDWRPGPAAPTIGANIAIRLIQTHLCVIYLFAGLSKLAGPNWWAGTALWGAIANLEYQSLDVVFLVHYPLIINVLTLTTLAWEISYSALVWPRLTRPIMLALAVPLHLGIAFCMGMITFGLAMLIANLAFVEPWVLRRLVDPLVARVAGAVSANAGAASSPAAEPPAARANARRETVAAR